MVAILDMPKEIQILLSDLVPRICSQDSVASVILFGSYSKGTYSRQSDIDIAVFIHDWTPSIHALYRTLSKLCTQYNADIQLQVFYEEELDDPVGIIEEIVCYGKDITYLSSHKFCLSKEESADSYG